MAKRKSDRRKSTSKKARKARPPRRSTKRPGRKRPAPRPSAKAKRRKAGTKRRATRSASPARAKRAVAERSTPARLDRDRRILEEVLPTPPSSLDMNRRGSAVRTGRAEMAQSQEHHRSMTPDINAGDVDVNVEDAYFVGDESPGGDNPTPDQDVVEEIGKALGVEYQDAEELRGADKLEERDKHRWELDPASSEDYKNRK